MQNDTCPKGEPGSPSVHLPSASAFGVAPAWRKISPLNPMSMVTTACRGSFGTTGLTAGLVPLVMTSGSYTDSAPVAGSRMVAWTNAPSCSELIIWQPEAAGDVPAGPVSRNGVASPLAVSGWAGITMSQLVLTAVDVTPCEEEAAAWWTLAGLPPEEATRTPAPRPRASTAVTGTTTRAVRFLPRRRTDG